MSTSLEQVSDLQFYNEIAARRRLRLKEARAAYWESLCELLGIMRGDPEGDEKAVACEAHDEIKAMQEMIAELDSYTGDYWLPDVIPVPNANRD